LRKQYPALSLRDRSFSWKIIKNINVQYEKELCCRVYNKKFQTDSWDQWENRHFINKITTVCASFNFPAVWCQLQSWKPNTFLNACPTNHSSCSW
jgi:hypothetical protein